MQRNDELDITIPLARVQQNQVGNKEEYLKIVQDAYTTQYLQALGVEPTDRHRKTVARHAPLEKCDIEALWGEDSVVAQQLRVVQPPVGRDAAVAAGARGDGASAAERMNTEWHSPTKFANVSPPELPAVATIAKSVRQSGQHGYDVRAIMEKEREQILTTMKMHDLVASEGVDEALTEELERVRRRARGDSHAESVPVLIQWGEEGTRELEKLKRKFILPFAAERKGRGGGAGDFAPWQSPALADPSVQVPRDLQADIQRPLEATLQQIMAEAVDYVENRLPLELLTTRKDPWLFAAVRERLGSPEAVRLTGLLAHLLYWTAFRHLHEPARRLPELTQQSLMLTVQELWSSLVEPARQRLGRRGELLARDSPVGICFVLPVFILTIKRGVEHVFHTQYPKVFNDPDYGAELSAQLVDQLNVMMMNIFDPDCCMASFGALDSSAQAIRIWRKLHVLQMKLGLTPATRMLGREFRTTPMVLLLMNGDGEGPASANARKLLQKSSSDTVLGTMAGMPPEKLRPADGGPGHGRRSQLPLQGPKPKLDEVRRAGLYRTACKRLASSGMEQVAGSSAAAKRIAAA